MGWVGNDGWRRTLGHFAGTNVCQASLKGTKIMILNFTKFSHFPFG